MDTRYAVNEDLAIVDLEPAIGRKHMWNIVAVLVEEQYQGLGLGTALMKTVCYDADLQGVELWLVPESLDGRQEWLVRWYEKMGFQPMEGARTGANYMIRKPKNPDPACTI